MAPNAAAKKYVGTVHLKLTQFYMLIISQENWKKRNMWLTRNLLYWQNIFSSLIQMQSLKRVIILSP